MRFSRISDWHELSEDGAYMVRAVREGARFRFESRLLVPAPGENTQLLGTFESAEAAKRCCRTHREEAAA